MAKANPTSGGARGRTARTRPDLRNPTKPELPVTQKTQANRAGPGHKSTRLARGDRRDMGPSSY
jgi:hypothetical protein